MSAEVLVESRGDNHYDWAENQAERAPQVRRKRVNSEEDRPVASFNVRGNDDRGFGFRAPVKRIALRIYPGASRRRSLLHCTGLWYLARMPNTEKNIISLALVTHTAAAILPNWSAVSTGLLAKNNEHYCWSDTDLCAFLNIVLIFNLLKWCSLKWHF